jgi:hypothetical protein
MRVREALPETLVRLATPATRALLATPETPAPTALLVRVGTLARRETPETPEPPETPAAAAAAAVALAATGTHQTLLRGIPEAPEAPVMPEPPATLELAPARTMALAALADRRGTLGPQTAHRGLLEIREYPARSERRGTLAPVPRLEALRQRTGPAEPALLVVQAQPERPEMLVPVLRLGALVVPPRQTGRGKAVTPATPETPPQQLALPLTPHKGYYRNVVIRSLSGRGRRLDRSRFHGPGSEVGKRKELMGPKLEFVCHPEDFGVIPAPYPARKAIPDWFRMIPPVLRPGLEQSTVKRCPPFLDALVTGWIIPLAADVEITSNEDASFIEYSWKFHRTMIENHSKDQVTTDKCPAPHHSQPPMKWLNYWAVKCPPGYSLLFTPPLNRPDPRFEAFSGIVDADGYFEFINFPFIWKQPNFHGIVEAGTPIAQVVPIKRSTMIKTATVRSMSAEDESEIEKTRARRRSHLSLYRDQIWERK